jgi:hypothetical protein
MKARARLASSSHLSLAEAALFFEEVNDHCNSAVTKPIYVRGTLQYDDGLAWRGELWLDDKTRLGPPSLQDETATIGPRLVHVDAILECIGEPDVAYARQQMLLEVSAFLSVVMQKAVRLPDHGRVWVWTADLKGCEVRNLGHGRIRKRPNRFRATPTLPNIKRVAVCMWHLLELGARPDRVS